MKNVRALIIVSLAVILIFAIIGCTAAPGSLLLGKWEEVQKNKRGKPIITEFIKDGTMIRGSQSGKYRIIDNTRFELEIHGSKIVIGYEVSKDELTMDMGGEKQKFTRVKS